MFSVTEEMKNEKKILWAIKSATRYIETHALKYELNRSLRNSAKFGEVRTGKGFLSEPSATMFRLKLMNVSRTDADDPRFAVERPAA